MQTAAAETSVGVGSMQHWLGGHALTQRDGAGGVGRETGGAQLARMNNRHANSASVERTCAHTDLALGPSKRTCGPQRCQPPAALQLFQPIMAWVQSKSNPQGSSWQVPGGGRFMHEGRVSLLAGFAGAGTQYHCCSSASRVVRRVGAACTTLTSKEGAHTMRCGRGGEPTKNAQHERFCHCAEFGGTLAQC